MPSRTFTDLAMPIYYTTQNTTIEIPAVVDEAVQELQPDGSPLVHWPFNI
jgi:hypothetical protein